MTVFNFFMNNLFAASNNSNLSLREKEINRIADNIIIEECLPFLALIHKIKELNTYEIAEQLQKNIIYDLNMLDNRLEHIKINSDNRKIIIYCLCSVMDEFIYKNSKIQSVIANGRTLLSIKFHETNGGENFFQFLDILCQNFEKNRHIIELLYFLINLGFQGKYYNDSNHKMKEICTMINRKLYQTMDNDKIFLTINENTSNIKEKLFRKNIIIFLITFISCLWFMLNLFLYDKTSNIISHHENIIFKKFDYGSVSPKN